MWPLNFPAAIIISGDREICQFKLPRALVNMWCLVKDLHGLFSSVHCDLKRIWEKLEVPSGFTTFSRVKFSSLLLQLARRGKAAVLNGFKAWSFWCPATNALWKLIFIEFGSQHRTIIHFLVLMRCARNISGKKTVCFTIKLSAGCYWMLFNI